MWGCDGGVQHGYLWAPQLYWCIGVMVGGVQHGCLGAPQLQPPGALVNSAAPNGVPFLSVKQWCVCVCACMFVSLHSTTACVLAVVDGYIALPCVCTNLYPKTRAGSVLGWSNACRDQRPPCVVFRWTVNLLSTFAVWRVVPQVLKVSTCNILLSKKYVVHSQRTLQPKIIHK